MTSIYATLSSIKSELGIVGSAQDLRLQALLEQASGFINEYCGRSFKRDVYVDNVVAYGNGSPLQVKNTPVIAIISIMLDGVVVPASSYQIDDANCGFIGGNWIDTAIIARGTMGVIYNGMRKKRYSVTYEAGYLLPDDVNRNLPYAIEKACIELVRGAYIATGRDIGIKSESIDGVGSITYHDNKPAAINADIATLLKPHKMAGGLL